MSEDDVLDLTAAERTLRKLADDAREATAAGRRPDDLFECYRLVADELDRLRARVHVLEGEGPHLDEGRPGMRTASLRATEQLGHLNLWWSPSIGLIRGVGNAGYDDAVPLVPAEPTDEKSRGEAYLRGHRDGRLAERAHADALSVKRARPGVPGYRGSGDAGSMGDPPQLPSGALYDGPPFAPELADAPLVTGESGALAPMVVDQPLHESTLPAELEQSPPPDPHRRVGWRCQRCRCEFRPNHRYCPACTYTVYENVTAEQRPDWDDDSEHTQRRRHPR